MLDLARGRAAAAFDRSIDTQVSRLRKKLEHDPAEPRIIKTIWGGGYMFARRRQPVMTRLLPRTLFGQMLLILLGGMLVSHAIGSWLYAHNRAEAVRAVGGFAATQRIANLARLIDEAPPAWRGRIVAAAQRCDAAHRAVAATAADRR